MGRRSQKPISDVKRFLFEALDLQAVGPEGLVLRFTRDELCRLASEAGQFTAGNKLDLAERIIAASPYGPRR